jgi:hypothetical protein
MGRQNWLNVDMDGLRRLLERRGKQFALFELVANVWDESAAEVHASLTRPVQGVSELTVVDDSPEGFKDLTDAYTLFGDSYKKGYAEKRGRFNAGEKMVLALCDSATILTTTGMVTFSPAGREVTKRMRRKVGSEFKGQLRLKLHEWEDIRKAALSLIPPMPTFFNKQQIAPRVPIHTWNATLPTVKADDEGNLRPTSRQTTISVYAPFYSEPTMLYEMGIPVVEIDSKYHVSIGQKVPLNIDRDNVTPAYLRTVLVEVLNNTEHMLCKDDATAGWVRDAAGDPRCSGDAIRKVMDLRFGTNRVSYDMTDVGSNREAASKEWTVVSGGSMSAGEWENARQANAIQAAGQLFPTGLSGKVPDKVYQPCEFTNAMADYDEFVNRVSPTLVGRPFRLRFIRDEAIVEGSINPDSSEYTVNIAKHDPANWQANIDLMLHELSHIVVRSNDHLNHMFYETCTTLGAKLAIWLASHPDAAARYLGRA